MSAQANPTSILQTGLGFWPSKVLLSAVELEVFTHLGASGMSGTALAQKLGLHPRGVADFFDTLVALGFLERSGASVSGMYQNTQDTAVFLDKNQPTYIGGMLEMANARLYGFWGDLTTALKTGAPQNETKHNQEPIFQNLYKDEAKLEQFLSAMAGISALNFKSFADKFDFSKYSTLCDVGGATGQLSIFCAQKNAHLNCVTFDLPEVAKVAQRWVHQAGLSERIMVASGNFFTDPLPKADVITMGMILHDWNLPNKMKLIRAAYEALPYGGALVAIENIIDDERRKNAFGLMMSLNMLIEFGDAFDFTGADFNAWCLEAGFKRTEIIPLQGPASAAVAYKEK